MPALAPRHGPGLTWTDRMAALGGQASFLASYVPPAATTGESSARSGADAGAARRRPSRIGAAVTPLTRCAVVALSAGLLLGADPVAAATERYAVSGGVIVAPAAVRAGEARAAALSAQAQGQAVASQTEALAVAHAALDAAAAVVPLTAALPVDAAPGALGPAVERLTALVASATSPAGPLTDSVRVAGSADERLRLSGEVADTAAEVFRLSMQVESLTQEAAAAESADRSLDLQVLEASVAAAAQAVADVGEIEPLVRLEASAPAARVDDDRPRPRLRATTSRARLSTEAPESVVRHVERWGNGAIPAAELCPVPFAPGALLQCDAAAALVELNAAYRAAHGTDLQVVSTYRTYEAQVALKAQKGGLAATPGTSNHGWGLAVDLGGIGGLGQFDMPGYRWLKEHAEEFGWHHPRVMEPGGGGPQEPWHWEFGTA